MHSGSDSFKAKKMRFRFHNTVLQTSKCNTLLLLNTEHLVAGSGLSSRSRPPSFPSEKNARQLMLYLFSGLIDAQKTYVFIPFPPDFRPVLRLMMDLAIVDQSEF